jgi:hypothetical protein
MKKQELAQYGKNNLEQAKEKFHNYRKSPSDGIFDQFLYQRNEHLKTIAYWEGFLSALELLEWNGEFDE